MVTKFRVRGQSLWGNIPCIYLAKVLVLHFCMSGCCKAGSYSGLGCRGHWGSPRDSQSLSDPSPEPGSQGHKGQPLSRAPVPSLGTGTGQAGPGAVGGWRPVLLWHHWVGGWWPCRLEWDPGLRAGCAEQGHWYLQAPDVVSAFVADPLRKSLERAINASGDYQRSLARCILRLCVLCGSIYLSFKDHVYYSVVAVFSTDE